jgi:hypothetical protein
LPSRRGGRRQHIVATGGGDLERPLGGLLASMGVLTLPT